MCRTQSKDYYLYSTHEENSTQFIYLITFCVHTVLGGIGCKSSTMMPGTTVQLERQVAKSAAEGLTKFVLCESER